METKKTFNAHYNEAQVYEYAKELNLDKKIIEILFARNITNLDEIKNFLNPSKNSFHDPMDLSGMKEGVERIKLALERKENILIFGDYDVDGISATAILIKTFKKMGLDASYYLPNRFQDGYGLTNQTIDKVAKKFAPNLIITVDCGITCVNEVNYAKSLGIDIIISDHHELDETLPDTICINPKIPNQKYPFSQLCGAGVAYKIAQALLKDKCDDELLSICAIATISDIVPLLDENRAIVSLGLKCFNSLPKGIKAILKENKIDATKINSTDISFKVSPKLNASGRMGEASDSLELYLEKDNEKIKSILEKINNHNKNRQQLCGEVYDDCINMLTKEKLCNTRCIILSSSEWDSGILGIIAARLVDQFRRPAFLFSEKDGMLKGSGRSIDEINIHDILLSSGDLLTTFGGHSMAAGLTLKKDNLENFKQRVDKFIKENVNDRIFTSINYYDIDLSENDITNDFVNQLNLLEPYGCMNPKPYFRINAKNASIQPLKNYKNHANICFKNNLKLIVFNYLDKINYINYCNDYSIIFEFQQSFYNKEFKGLVKSFDFSTLINKNIDNYSNASYLYQFISNNNSNNKNINYYKNKELVSLLLDNSKNRFGTLFICYNYKTYMDFFKQYDTSFIENVYLFELENNGGFNSFVFAPTNLTALKDYERVVFLEPILSDQFLNDIGFETKIYLPSECNFRVSFINKLDLSREKIGEVFSGIKMLKNAVYPNEQKLYQDITRNLKKKIPFEMFIFCKNIFIQLNVISINKLDEGISISVNNDIKSNLGNSQLYNIISLLYKSLGGKV